MSQPLQNINISAPGFRGLNTEDSPVGLDPAFASIANNCIIDKYGRIGARKGRDLLTTAATPLGTSAGIAGLIEHTDTTGGNTVFSTGNNKIFSGTTTLTDVTPAATTITADNWKMVNFDYHCYFFQKGHVPLIYSDHVGTLEKLSAHPTYAGTAPQGNEVLAAFGRLWVGDIAGDKGTLYWSGLLDGAVWTASDTGSIDLTRVWPTGFDEIVALVAHNGYLVIFGKRTILIYSGATTPSTMTLQDTIANVGCVARDSVQHTGTDVIFLSDQGVRSLGRVIQEKSLPLRDISKNIRSDLLALLSTQVTKLASVYSASDAFYLLSFPDAKQVYCFDMRAPMEDGSYRVTTWSNVTYLALARLADGSVYIGDVAGISNYTGYYENGATYRLSYYTHPMAFGDSSRLKMLKDMHVTFIGGQNAQAYVFWSYDYTGDYRSQALSISAGVLAEFNVSEFNVSTSQYSASIIIDKHSVKPSGAGTLASIGVEVLIDNDPISIQEINIQALMGRMV